MKLFYFGSVCSQEVFNETVAQSAVKPSASAQNFEYALIKGFSAHPEVELTVASAESIAPYPHGNRLFLKNRKDVLTPRATAQILPAINLPGIKQHNHAAGAAALLKKWLAENKTEHNKCVLMYGLYPKVARCLLNLCKHAGCNICAVITDVPSCMFATTGSKNLVKKLFATTCRKSAMNLQGQFDAYVYLTRDMENAVAPGKPFIVVEAIADTTLFDHLPAVQKATPPALMYAGTLHQTYGINLMMESFERVQTPCELWLFGSGDYEEEILRRAQDNPRIRFFGRVSREEVLQREKEASLLLNLRNAKDEYTRYSFPSKMVEYMLSGTPLLTTKLPGIPDEYEEYCYTLANRTPQHLAETIDHLLQHAPLSAKGEQAKTYIQKQKSSTVQAGRILHFLSRQVQKCARAA